MPNDATIEVPGAKAEDKRRVIDLSDIYAAEVRQQEIAMVTPMKAPELLYAFNRAWLTVDQLVKQLTETETAAKREVERVKADLLLNRVEDILKQKGVGSTKDTRDAVIVLDQKYSDAQDRADQLHATVEWLKGKRDGFENAFTSVKKIMGEDTYNMSGRMPNPDLKHGAPPTTSTRVEYRPAPEATKQPSTPAAAPRVGYGKSRY